MTPTQMNYLTKRVNEIKADKISSLMGKTPKIPSLSWDEMKAQILSGKAKLITSSGSYTDLGKAFKFVDDRVGLRKTRDAAIATRIKVIERRAEKLIDEIILGKGDIPIVKAIEQFAKS